MTAKRFAIILAALTMLAGTAGMSAYANEAEETEVVVEEAVVSEEEVIEGTETTEEAGEPVAMVGATGYATIDEAIANWTNGATLTLLDDVTLSDVIVLKSTEHHTLDLGTFTMTAASGKHAIEIIPEGVGTASRLCLTIDADDDNPGKLVATGKSCIYYTNTNKIADRLTITIKGGVFEGSYAMNLASGPRTALGITNSPIRGQSAPYVVIEGGVFNATVLINAGMLKMTGGVCNSSFTCNGDSTAYRLISGGKFKSVPTLTHDAEGKLTIGTSKGVYNGDIYIDEDGYYVIDSTAVSEKPGVYEASSANAYKSQFNFSAIKDDKVVYFETAEAAMKGFTDVKLYVNYSGDKAVTSGTFTLDATEGVYTGNVTLSKTAKFVIKYPEDIPYIGNVTNNTEYYGIEITETVSEGVVTKIYAGYEIIDETNGVLKVVDGDEVKYFKSFDKAAESLYGTTGKTIVLIKDLTTVFINYNSYKNVPTEIIFDLNGNSITTSNINGNSFNGEASIIFIDSSAEKTGAVTKDILAKIDSYGYTPIVKGGIWYADPSAYLALGYEAVVTDDGKYFVQVKDEAAVEVVPDDDAESIDVETDVYYEDEAGNIIGGQVTVSLPADAFEETTASTIILKVSATTPDEASAEFVGPTATVYEIEFVDENGNDVEFKGTAVVEIPYSGTDYENRRVYFISENGYEDMKAVYDVDKKAFVFETTHFSQYAIVDPSLLEEGIAEKVAIMFKATANPNVYDIYAVAIDGQINRFSSTQLKFNIENATTNRTDVVYEITPATNIKMTEPDVDGYVLFNFDGVNAPDSKVASTVHFATVTFDGYGKFTFTTIDTAAKAMLHTAEIVDSVVDDYTVAGNADGKFKLVLSGNGENADNETGAFGDTITTELYVPTKNLSVNIAFPNTVENNVNLYQQMKLTVSGGDLEQALTIDLGTDYVVSALDVYNGRLGKAVVPSFANSAYTVEINNLLTVNTSYVVTVEGAGYRTARYTVTMTDDKTLNFWNNVKDNDTYIEEDKKAVKTTFLAGDIVKDNDINIYDLSAVVSYFGENMNTEAYNAYAKYDLNRDGKIDSKDVAYVLVSWGN